MLLHTRPPECETLLGTKQLTKRINIDIEHGNFAQCRILPFLHGKGCFFTLSRGNCQGNNDSFLFLRLVALRLGRMLHKSVVPVQRQLTQLTKYISVVRSVYYKRQKRHVFLLSLKKRLSCSCFTSRVRCVAFKSRLENNQDIHLAKQIHNCAFSSTFSLGFPSTAKVSFILASPFFQSQKTYECNHEHYTNCNWHRPCQ